MLQHATSLSKNKKLTFCKNRLFDSDLFCSKTEETLSLVSVIYRKQSTIMLKLLKKFAIMLIVGEQLAIKQYLIVEKQVSIQQYLTVKKQFIIMLIVGKQLAIMLIVGKQLAINQYLIVGKQPAINFCIWKVLCCSSVSSLYSSHQF